MGHPWLFNREIKVGEILDEFGLIDVGYFLVEMKN